LHKINEYEAPILAQRNDMKILASQVACCRHWEPHSHTGQGHFMPNKRPELLKDTTPYHSARSKRKDPLPRSTTNQPTPVKLKDPEDLDREQLLQLLLMTQEELRKVKESEQALREELEYLKGHPYEAVFQMCESKSEDASRRVVGVKDYQALYKKNGVGDSISVVGRDSLEIFKYGLLWARQGITFEELGIYMNLNRTTAKRRMEDWVNSLFPWAQSQIKFSELPEWILHNPEELQKEFPNHLFYFVDGTVLKIWSPKDAKCRRIHYSNKHGCCVWVFFIVVDPMGHIVYLSNVEAGHKHDATHWNECNVAKSLEEFYEDKEHDKWKLSLGGDKAYPRIELPKDWDLYVTMTAEEDNTKGDKDNHMVLDTNNDNVNDMGSEKTHDDMSDHDVSNDNRHRTPEIAKWRAVVERSIGSIKRWKILDNVAFLSRVKGPNLRKLLCVVCALVNHERELNQLSW
jgi:hypothetical protein